MQWAQHGQQVPYCRASSWWPSLGISASVQLVQWNTGRREFWCRGNWTGIVWSSALLASRLQTVHRCTPLWACSWGERRESSEQTFTAGTTHWTTPRKLHGCSAHYEDKCCTWYLPCPTYHPFLPSVCFCLVHWELIMDKLARRCGGDPGL